MKIRTQFLRRVKDLQSGFLAVLLTVVATSASAQTASVRALPVRLTVPIGVVDATPVSKGTDKTNVIELTIVTASLGGNPITLSLTGVPTGLTATLSTNSIDVDGTHSALLTVSSDGTIAQGTHDMAIVIGGSASYRLPIPVISAHFWSGISYTNGVTGNVTATGNWLGNVVPGATDDVVFKDLGGVSAINNPTNVIVNSDLTIASLRFSQELNADANRFHNLEIVSGATLNVTGAGGFSMLRDVKNLGRRSEISISGGGKLRVVNPAANFSLLIDAQQNNTLDMRLLNNLEIDVNRIPIGDYLSYPNYFTNGWQGTGSGNEVNRFLPLVYLAKTNFIRGAFADPNDYNDLGVREYTLTIGNNNVQGSTSNLRFTLGNSNAFFLDSICFAHALSGGSGNNFNFNSANSYALFRGAGGLNSRMSVFALADMASPAPPAAANGRSQVNFANQSGCSVDALIDRLWLGVDRTNNSGQMTVQASLTFAAGTFDVNNAFLGYQVSGDNQGSASSTGFAGPEGTINVNSNANSAGAIFRVNQNLNLGYTTASAPGGTTSAERCWGRVVVNGGTVFANSIVCGGVTKLSTNNQISITRGKLVVTNAIASADARLASFSLGSASDVTLYGVTTGQTNIFVNTISIPAAGGVTYVRIPQIAGYTTGTATVPLISYTDNSPDLSGLSIVPPSGKFVKSVKDNTIDKLIEVTFTDEPPIVVVWRGDESSIWDTATANWVTLVGGIKTNFSEGFSVIFDDTYPASPTTISIPSPVSPGQVAATFGVVVSNRSYTFNNGTILGNATIRKVGTGDLTINASASTAVDMVQGALAGSSSAVVGPTILRSGTTMTGYAGTINLGLTASNATVNVTGTVNGGLTISAGTVANSGTINGSISMTSGSILNNQVTGVMNVTLPWTVTTNSTLINNGDIYHFGTTSGNLGLNVDGTLKGVGRIIQNGIQLSSDVRVTMRAGGNLQIGNSANEVTNMTIAVRLDLLNGSTATLDVDNSGPSYDHLVLAANGGINGFGKVNFGNGNEQGGTVFLNRFAGPAFNGSTVLTPFYQDINTPLTSNPPDNANPAIPKIQPQPAPGLVWSTYEVITNLTLSVVPIPVITNSVTSTNMTIEWPADYRGWRLERQISTLDVGLSQVATNWTTLYTALGGTNSSTLYYPDITNNPSLFWIRQTVNIDKTNPAVFFRVTYP